MKGSADAEGGGIGFGNYPRVCQAYYDAVDPSFAMRTHAHNQWLSILVETGPIGLLIFACWLGLIARLVWRKRHVSPERFAAGVAVLINLVIVMLVHDPLQHSASGLALACALGVILGRDGEVRV